MTYRASGYHQALDISSYSGGWKPVGTGRHGNVEFAGWGGSFGWWSRVMVLIPSFPDLC